jgi:hypothetical protein
VPSIYVFSRFIRIQSRAATFGSIRSFPQWAVARRSMRSRGSTV